MPSLRDQLPEIFGNKPKKKEMTPQELGPEAFFVVIALPFILAMLCLVGLALWL